MMTSKSLVTTLIMATSVAFGARESVTPTQKVLEMMEGMKAKGIKAKKEESVRFSAFQQWCTDLSAEKTKAIEDAAEMIEKLDADIATASADIEEATKIIAELDEDLGRWDKDKKAATDVRKKERVDYEATHKEYADIVDALDRAIAVLKSQPSNIAQKSLMQTHVEKIMNARIVPEKASRVLAAFLQDMQPAELDYQAPEAYGYSSQSGGVLKMLEELRVRFRGEKTDLEKEEISARAAYQDVMQRLTDQIEAAEKEVATKTKFRAQRKADKAEAEGELAETKRIKAEDEKYLSDMTAMCSKKSEDFEARQTLRAEEIEALSKAIEIISSQAVAGNAEKYGVAAAALAQQSTSLAQLRNAASKNPNMERVAALLAERAKALHSPTLALAAQKAETDPFAKVKKMIQSLIVKLLEEQASEADHKAWCDAELGTNKKTRTYKAEEVEELTAEVEKQTALSAKLAGEIADLTEEISELEASMSKATAERSEEKEKNAETVADSKEAQVAVAEALAVLRDFYAKAAQATALVQQTPAEDAPATFDKAYKGMGAESGGIIGMLEVIESDFARLQTTTETAEDEAVADYKKFMAESNQDKAVKEAQVEHKEAKKTTTDEILVSTKRSLEQTQSELDAAIAYYEKLKPDCIDSGIEWEERIKRRNQELQSLREAYKILSGEEVPSLNDMKAEQIEP
jgi:hypothetical protein